MTAAAASAAAYRGPLRAARGRSDPDRVILASGRLAARIINGLPFAAMGHYARRFPLSEVPFACELAVCTNLAQHPEAKARSAHQGYA